LEIERGRQRCTSQWSDCSKSLTYGRWIEAVAKYVSASLKYKRNNRWQFN
jgi:hypothetical protein